jgi:hypothetical protein
MAWLHQVECARDIRETRAFFTKELFPGVAAVSGSPVAPDSSSSMTPDPVRLSLPVDLDGKNYAIFESSPKKITSELSYDKIMVM